MLKPHWTTLSIQINAHTNGNACRAHSLDFRHFWKWRDSSVLAIAPHHRRDLDPNHSATTKCWGKVLKNVKIFTIKKFHLRIESYRFYTFPMEKPLNVHFRVTMRTFSLVSANTWNRAASQILYCSAYIKAFKSFISTNLSWIYMRIWWTRVIWSDHVTHFNPGHIDIKYSHHAAYTRYLHQTAHRRKSKYKQYV